MDFNSIELCMAFFVILDVIGFVDAVFVEQKFDNINVLNLKFKLLIIIFGLYNIKLIVQNFVYIFFSFIETKKTCLKIKKKLFLIICVKCICIIFLIFFPYTVFKELKHFTSKD